MRNTYRVTWYMPDGRPGPWKRFQAMGVFDAMAQAKEYRPRSTIYSVRLAA